MTRVKCVTIGRSERFCDRRTMKVKKLFREVGVVLFIHFMKGHLTSINLPSTLEPVGLTKD